MSPGVSEGAIPKDVHVDLKFAAIPTPRLKDDSAPATISSIIFDAGSTAWIAADAWPINCGRASICFSTLHSSPAFARLLESPVVKINVMVEISFKLVVQLITESHMLVDATYLACK